MAMKVLIGVALTGLLGTVGWLHTQLGAQHAQALRMEARIEALEDELEEAQIPAAPLGASAMPSARSRGTAPDPAPAPAHLEVDDALRTRVLSAPGRTGDAPSDAARVVRDALLDVLSTEDPELREGFRDLVREEQEVLRDERREQRQQRWEDQMSDRLAKLAADQGLTQAQQDALFALMTASRDRIRESFRAARESEDPPSREDLRKTVETAREEADKEARELLNDSQFEAYQQLQQEQQRFGRGGGGRQRQGPAPE